MEGKYKQGFFGCWFLFVALGFFDGNGFAGCMLVSKRQWQVGSLKKTGLDSPLYCTESTSIAPVLQQQRVAQSQAEPFAFV